MPWPASPYEAALAVRVALAQVVEQARRMGLDPAMVSSLLTEELEKTNSRLSHTRCTAPADAGRGCALLDTQNK